MTNRKLLFLLGNCLFALNSVELKADDNAPPVVLAVRENAERIRTGIYTARGTITVTTGILPHPEPVRKPDGTFDFPGQAERFKPGPDGKMPAPPQLEERVEVYDESVESAFDYDNNRLLFWRERKLVSGEATRFSGAPTSALVSLPDKCMIVRGFQSPKLDVSIEPAISDIRSFKPELNATMHPVVKPVFDARTIGQGGYDQLLTRGMEFLGGGSLEKLKVTNVGGGIHELEWVYSYGEAAPSVLVAKWWCDASQGGQPVRFVLQSKDVRENIPVELKSPDRPPQEQAEYAWQKITDVWVLKSLDLTIRDRRVTEQWQLTFDWQSLNEPVAESRFDWQTWPLPNGSQVVDTRMGDDKLMVVERVGQQAEIPVQPQLPVATVDNSQWYLILLNVAILGLLAGYVVYRKLK